MTHSVIIGIIVLGLVVYVRYWRAEVFGYGVQITVDLFPGGVKLWLPVSDHLVEIDRNDWVLTAGIAFLSGMMILAETARRLALNEP